MPRVDIWIRKNDLPKWESIKDKPEFLHNALSVRESYSALSPVEKKSVKEHISQIPKVIKTPQDARKSVEPIVKDSGVCKHGAISEFCKHAKMVNGKKVCR